jgi:protein-tyrosine phosphatase
MQYRRLPLSGMHNARELGGWYTPEGLTQYGVFLRTEVPSAITEEDAAFLKDYGVRMDIDLRGASELESMPDKLADAPWCEYVHLPMFNRQVARGASAGGGPSQSYAPSDFSWGVMYARMADNQKDWVRDVFEALGRCEGAAMFHCTTGKDRTGIVTALLLGLCGVAGEDIIADYCVSQVYLSWIYDSMKAKLESEKAAAQDPFFSTAPENMEALLKHLHENYGGIPDYLRACGVSDELASKLKARLLGKA